MDISQSPADEDKSSSIDVPDEHYQHSWNSWLKKTRPASDGTSLALSKTGRSFREESTLCIQLAQPQGTDANVIDGLCNICRWFLDNLRFISDQLVPFSLDRGDGPNEIEIQLWGTKTLLVQAPNGGCRWCKRTLLEWDKRQPDDGEDWPLGTLIELTFQDFLSVRTIQRKQPSRKNLLKSALRLYPTETLPTLPLEQALHWLQKCNREHICIKPKDCIKLPTRLLELQRERLRLYRTNDLPPTTQYATLSHCWGPKGVDFKLTGNLLDSFQQSISEELLPKTFQDAILISRHLGIRYLWIDSLCIIQDDTIDWGKESATMSQVYGNSYLTIAASSAKDGSEGCFSTQDRVNKIQVETMAWREETLHSQAFEIVPDSMFLESTSGSVLAQRGWVLQERLLSPRSLHFSNAQLFWDCDTDMSCESFPSGLPVTETGLNTHINKGDISRRWKTILSHYTTCKLTYPKDILVALSGIIRKLEEGNHDTCVAGIWRRNPESKLLWTREMKNTEIPSNKEESYTAPSWSWASPFGGYRQISSFSPYMSKEDKWTIEVLDMHTVPIGEDRLGHIIGGSLSLACKNLIQASLLFESNSAKAKLELPTYGPLKSCEVKLDKRDYRDPAVFILQFCNPYGKEDPAIQRLLGLVIVPTGNMRGQYKRIGYFYSRGSEDESWLRDHLKLHTTLQDSEKKVADYAVIRFVEHGEEQWGVIEITLLRCDALLMV